MARRPRHEVAGGLQHVFARGNNRQPIYLDDGDRQAYLRLLAIVVRRRRWRCLSYCLMPNHVHLLIETPEPNLGRGMQQLHGDYVREFQKRHGVSGHLFQGRFGSVAVTSDEQLWTVARYIALNPVEARLCATPDAWPWSSHAATVAAATPAWLDGERLRAAFIGHGGYEAFVADGAALPR